MKQDQKIITGFKTVILSLCLYIVELLYLPIFAALQKAQVNEQGFYTDCCKYITEQPYPIVLVLTGMIAALGILLIVRGYKEKYK